MPYDIDIHARGVFTRAEARSSLKRFKKTDGYKALLRKTIADSAQLEKHGSPTQQRRARLDKLTAELELTELKSGQKPSEFHGLLNLPDPLRGED